jgi:hypothetical protein
MYWIDLSQLELTYQTRDLHYRFNVFNNFFFYYMIKTWISTQNQSNSKDETEKQKLIK